MVSDLVERCIYPVLLTTVFTRLQAWPQIEACLDWRPGLAALCPVTWGIICPQPMTIAFHAKCNIGICD